MHEDDERVDREKMVRGIIRVLSGGDRGDMPPSKKHELFIPYPEEAENWEKFPIPPEVVQKFYTLADERTDVDKELPYEPLGTARNASNKANDQRFRLKQGDIVYFKPDSKGREVAEIALSSIWRDAPAIDQKITGTYGFFREIGEELLPFNKDRKYLSPAEMVFGFVEERPAEEANKQQEQATAYKSRVRFSHGIHQATPENDGPYLDPVPLKILSSPKPPSPNLYFKQKEKPKNKYIYKPKFAAKDHHPQGRKFYLHHRRQELLKKVQPPWETIYKMEEDPNLKQKVLITPLAPKQSFWFHVDFENLNDYELGMLCYALQPSENYYHKIGMGKPLGLGSVQIEPAVLCLINRTKRYKKGVNPFAEKQARYHGVWRCPTLGTELPEAYALEREVAAAGKPVDFEEQKMKFADHMNDDVKNAFNLLGNINTKHPVHAPLTAEQRNRGKDEDETFQWFVNNDEEYRKAMNQNERQGASNRNEAGQALDPITKDTKSLPTLKYN